MMSYFKYKHDVMSDRDGVLGGGTERRRAVLHGGHADEHVLLLLAGRC